MLFLNDRPKKSKCTNTFTGVAGMEEGGNGEGRKKKRRQGGERRRVGGEEKHTDGSG